MGILGASECFAAETRKECLPSKQDVDGMPTELRERRWARVIVPQSPYRFRLSSSLLEWNGVGNARVNDILHDTVLNDTEAL